MRQLIERRLVVFLFVIVLVIFSFAHHDTQKLNRAYTSVAQKSSGTLASLAGITAPR